MDEKILLKYIQNECSEAELAQIKEWLDESPDHAKELFTLELAFNSKQIRKYSEDKYIKEAREKLRNRIASEASAKRTFRLNRIVRYSAAAAVAAVIFISGMFMLNENRSMLTITAENEEIKEVVLPDGSKVWLNKHASLKHPTSFKKKNRTVSLEGEAYFEVESNPEHPFIVKTKAMDVTVLGTSFNIQSCKARDIASLTLIEGTVILSPGQRAELIKSLRSMQVVEKPEVRLDAVWHNQLIPFNQATITEICKTLEIIYDVKFTADFDSDTTTYSGVLKSKEDINQVLQSLEKSIPIKYTIKGDMVHISLK